MTQLPTAQSERVTRSVLVMFKTKRPPHATRSDTPPPLAAIALTLFPDKITTVTTAAVTTEILSVTN